MALQSNIRASISLRVFHAWPRRGCARFQACSQICFACFQCCHLVPQMRSVLPLGLRTGGFIVQMLLLHTACLVCYTKLDLQSLHCTFLVFQTSGQVADFSAHVLLLLLMLRSSFVGNVQLMLQAFHIVFEALIRPQDSLDFALQLKNAALRSLLLRLQLFGMLPLFLQGERTSSAWHIYA
jgi:hypothetical protein